MPITHVLFFADESGRAPVIDWLETLELRPKAKLLVRVELLEEHGHELRRPFTDLLRDGIRELRARFGHTNYRILYFLNHGEAILTNGLTKEDEVPDAEINIAVERRAQYVLDPKRFTYRGT